MPLSFSDAEEFLKAYELNPEKVKLEIQEELSSIGIETAEPPVDPDYSNVVLGGKIHLVTPKEVAKSKIQEILEKLKNTRSAYDPDA